MERQEFTIKGPVGRLKGFKRFDYANASISSEFFVIELFPSL
jgi:hypothetical protein